jgi:hypothetical protein
VVAHGLELADGAVACPPRVEAGEVVGEVPGGGNRVMSAPVSATMTSAVRVLMPGIEQMSFARYGYDLNNRRFKHPITITVRGHVLTMSTDANDAYGLAITGLNRHAHASALAPIRLILETLAWLSCLLEDPDEKVRRSRAYRLAMNVTESYRRVGQTYKRVAPNSTEAAEINSPMAAACDRMKRELIDLATEDGVTIAPQPGSLSKLAEQYLPDHGGYLTYAILDSAGVHASAVHGFLFYGDPETGFTDYAFKGLFDRRAYWTAVAISLYLGICDLAAAELGWPDWNATAAATRRQFRPLASCYAALRIHMARGYSGTGNADGGHGRGGLVGGGTVPMSDPGR